MRTHAAPPAQVQTHAPTHAHAQAQAAPGVTAAALAPSAMPSRASALSVLHTGQQPRVVFDPQPQQRRVSYAPAALAQKNSNTAHVQAAPVKPAPPSAQSQKTAPARAQPTQTQQPARPSGIKPPAPSANASANANATKKPPGKTEAKVKAPANDTKQPPRAGNTQAGAKRAATQPGAARKPQQAVPSSRATSTAEREEAEEEEEEQGVLMDDGASEDADESAYFTDEAQEEVSELPRPAAPAEAFAGAGMYGAHFLGSSYANPYDAAFAQAQAQMQAALMAQMAQAGAFAAGAAGVPSASGYIPSYGQPHTLYMPPPLATPMGARGAPQPGFGYGMPNAFGLTPGMPAGFYQPHAQMTLAQAQQFVPATPGAQPLSQQQMLPQVPSSPAVAPTPMHTQAPAAHTMAGSAGTRTASQQQPQTVAPAAESAPTVTVTQLYSNNRAAAPSSTPATATLPAPSIPVAATKTQSAAPRQVPSSVASTASLIDLSSPARPSASSQRPAGTPTRSNSKIAFLREVGNVTEPTLAWTVVPEKPAPSAGLSQAALVPSGTSGPSIPAASLLSSSTTPAPKPALAPAEATSSFRLPPGAPSVSSSAPVTQAVAAEAAPPSALRPVADAEFNTGMITNLPPRFPTLTLRRLLVPAYLRAQVSLALLNDAVAKIAESAGQAGGKLTLTEAQFRDTFDLGANS